MQIAMNQGIDEAAWDETWYTSYHQSHSVSIQEIKFIRHYRVGVN